MKGKIIIGLMCIILSLSLICAADFTPQGNITLRNIYNIQNATSLTIGNGTVYINPSGFFGWLNWSWLTNIPAYVRDYNSDITGNITALNASINNTLINNYVPYVGANKAVYLNNQTLEIQNTKGVNVTLNNFVEHTQEMMTNTLLDKSRSTLSATGGVLNYTLIAVYGCGQFNFNGTLYPISGSPCVQNATVSLIAGTDITPKDNFVYWELVGGVPTMKTAESPGALATTIPVAEFEVGTVSGTSYTIYSYNRARSEVDTFVNRVLMRFEDMGAIYKSGFTTTAATKNVKIDTGYFYNGIFEMYTNVSLNSSIDGFFRINSSSGFITTTSFDGITFAQYQTGEAVTDNRYLNVVWGIVPTSTTASGTSPTTPKLVAIIQSKPSTEYTTTALAEQDLFSMTNYYPNDVQKKEVFVPIARQVIRYRTGGGGTGTAQTLSNGLLYIDLRGKTTSAGGAPTPSTSDHAALINLDYDNSGHSGFAPEGYGDNWNKTYADTLYAGIQWGYNFTTATYNLYDSRWYTPNNGITLNTDNLTNLAGLTNKTIVDWANITNKPSIPGNDGITLNTLNLTNLAGLTNKTISDWTNITNKPTIPGNNGITIDAANITTGTIAWTRLPTFTNALTLHWLNITNKPVACGAGLAVGTIGDTLTCINPVASSDATWTLHNSFPAACGAGNYVTTIGDTNTCAVPSGANDGHTHNALNITTATGLNNKLTLALNNLTAGTLGVNLNMSYTNITDVNYIKFKKIAGACDLTINGSICANQSGIFIVG